MRARYGVSFVSWKLWLIFCSSKHSEISCYIGLCCNGTWAVAQCGKLTFWSTCPKAKVPYRFYTKFHSPGPLFYLPSSKCTHICAISMPQKRVQAMEIDNLSNTDLLIMFTELFVLISWNWFMRFSMSFGSDKAIYNNCPGQSCAISGWYNDMLQDHLANKILKQICLSSQSGCSCWWPGIVKCWGICIHCLNIGNNPLQWVHHFQGKKYGCFETTHSFLLRFSAI